MMMYIEKLENEEMNILFLTIELQNYVKLRY